MAAFTRCVIDAHDEWDSLHTLATVERDGDSVKYGTMAAIDPGIHPDRYPLLIGGLAASAVAEKHPPYALMLQIEAFGTIIPQEGLADPAEREKFEEDRKNRTIHKRPDAKEGAWAWLVDYQGNTWCAVKIRGKDGAADEIQEHFYPAGSEEIGGSMQEALAAAMQVFGSAQ